MLLLGIYIGITITLLLGAIVYGINNHESNILDWVSVIGGVIFWPITFVYLTYLLMKDIILSLKKNRA